MDKNFLHRMLSAEGEQMSFSVHKKTKIKTEWMPKDTRKETERKVLKL
jgi:hypothetical protein